MRPDFVQVYDVYYGKVRSYAAKLLGRDEADDVAQQVFTKIAHAIDTLADTSRLSSWVFAIALNTARDAARKRARDDGLGAAVLGPDGALRTPEEEAMRREMIACYLDYVGRLPRAYYETFVLAEFEQLTGDEIAVRLGLPKSTVKIRLHRARATLHRELRQHCQCYYNDRGVLMAEPRP